MAQIKTLQEKTNEAIRLIKAVAKNDVIEVCYSGGKDSDVILQLAKMSGVKYRAIYKCTTIDPPRTIKHCLDNNVEILRPQISFLHLIEKKGMPTRRARFCCEKLKEYKVLDKAIQGIRRVESQHRMGRYNESEKVVCRNYGNKTNHVDVVLPILDWSDSDIVRFINEHDIKCHPLYYDKNGNFHVERRLGCVGCPLHSDNGRSDYKNNPKLLRLVVKATEKWWHTHPNTNSRKKFDNVYALVAHNLFYNTYEQFNIANRGGLFEARDWKTEIENYFNITL